MGRVNSKNFLACFSPPVMVATFIFETGMAVYTVYRYKLSKKGRLILLLLLCLAFFQIAEYFVCTRSSVAVGASRFGYASITLLPALGLYLMSELSVPMRNKAAIFMFSISALLVAYFLLSPSAFSGYQCIGNYVIFQIGTSQMRLYGTYYYGLIALALSKGVKFLTDNPKAKKNVRRPVQWFVAGYLVFIVPVAVLLVVHPDTRRAIPSILCGFAVSLAVILAAKVAPLSLKKR